MKGLTSKEYLFLRVISVVIFINAVAFYNVSHYMQTFVANFFETVALTIALTEGVGRSSRFLDSR
jgi:uncharacterized protein (UPF0333 family)